MEQFETREEEERPDPRRFADAIEYIYNNTAPGDKAREVAVLSSLPNMDKLLQFDASPFSKMMSEIGEFSRDVVKATRWSNGMGVSQNLLYQNFQGPTSHRNPKRHLDRKLVAYTCKDTECQAFWRLDREKLEANAKDKPICIACQDADGMEKMLEWDFGLLYSYECTSCNGPVMSNNPSVMSNNPYVRSQWQCCYCDSHNTFHKRKY
ncbi:hypothetical protein EG328_008752 [Venturia inaequalis]|uniref:Uncharacterized protein n=1 Tax=Venturia inaequalis TaxID=5025 RepID=A0A8H3VC80_VENIN|nr:hypothetical protein EG328_008752 [Venturia inaequalis]